jgi:hypothetical protein
MQKLKIITVSLCVYAMSLTSCSAQKNKEIQTSDTLAVEQREQRPQGPGQNNRERPTFSDLLMKMDANKDGLLSSQEIKGPLSEMFSKVDTNGDGFISEEEFNKMPPPPPRGK